MNGQVHVIGIEGCWSSVPFTPGYAPIGSGAAVLADDDEIINPTTGRRAPIETIGELAADGFITRFARGSVIPRDVSTLPLQVMILSNNVIDALAWPGLGGETLFAGMIYCGIVHQLGSTVGLAMGVFENLAAKDRWGTVAITQALMPLIDASNDSAEVREILKLGFGLNQRDPRLAALRVRHRADGVSLERSVQVFRHWATNTAAPWTTTEIATFDRIVAGGPVELQ